ncbi:hypothetical protein [Fodinibius salsisoli]|uniref:Restriction endonuclease n=1 Tax=Fodinibius salsisoli TaxID=2820877 RepID=A0ABT3PTV0_9BACT|nr:hypothetical protein [Fodinibius salsisoli]MCW9709262.1 hypothetical protein [Fodinibius salsisoli]
MRLDRTEIEAWGKRHGAKGEFPRLISKLIFETTPRDTKLDIPSGSAVFLEGWDGKVICSEDTSYVPQGNSLWEFKTNGGTAEANVDYQKRTDDPLGFEPTESVFVFVTTAYWDNRDDWQEKKQQEDVWKDVQAYDCRNLVNWLDKAPVTRRWFFTILGKPVNQLLTVEEFWEEWSIGPSGQLPPSAVSAGRDYESQELINFGSSEANDSKRIFSKELQQDVI